MLSVRLVATIHCDYRHPDFTRCPRMDEHAERPTPGEAGSATYRLRREASAAFEARGWRFYPGGVAYCSDHTPAGKAKAAGPKPKEKK